MTHDPRSFVALFTWTLALGASACGEPEPPASDGSSTTSAESETTTGSSGPDATTTASTSADGSTTTSTTGGSTDTTEGDETAAPCGNGVLDPGEECDGDDYGDVASCNDLDPTLAGWLTCTAACTFDTSACQTEPDMGVVLDELISSGGDGIEIYNFGRSPFDLSGYFLTDELTDPDDSYDPMADLEELEFPEGTVLAPGERMVVFQGGPPDSHLFGLSTAGDAVTLLDPDLEVVDFVAYGDGEAEVSYCRLPSGPTGTWTAGCTPTLGDPNLP
ncbi:lamin tail domain-containing protein [Paraliomyxa miuraensis]|uniref:lamin tail domain-containing protein n=1 Tax=Paraliomyxa miuraensis TaxID=376150 RepID=UPI00225A30D3|nr:lamin tail domain-containing protein [Paraliomyxa miuraensis]MCX4243895.1 lamin tail domain-containing protein [Paraliomyxa miuraensis]